MSDENKDFVIKDKRLFSGETQESEATKATESTRRIDGIDEIDEIDGDRSRSRCGKNRRI